MTINPLADELNRIIEDGSPAVFRLLSRLGKEMYFPKGIVDQSAEAKQKAYRFNATIGIATQDKRAMFLPSLYGLIKELNPDESLAYPPTTGSPRLRERWLQHQRDENPSMRDKEVSLPVVTAGITHGLSLVADMFCDEGDPLLLPDLLWGNYRMIFGLRRGAKTVSYPFFGPGGGFNVKALKDTLTGLPAGSKAIILLNFPHNPTGYTPTPAEADGIVEAISVEAESGRDIVAVTDDAYFGFFYEDHIIKESLFSRLCDLHPRVLAVKLDGATKEDYAWGLRIGFLTLGTNKPAEATGLYPALERKIGGAIRSYVSCCSMLAQSMLLRALDSPGYRREKEERFQLLRGRYAEVKRLTRSGKYEDAFTALPFNSGYFMCLRLKEGNAEELRKRLLEEEGVGVISLGGGDVRVAFSCLEKQEMQELFDILYNAVMKTRQERR